VAGVRAHLAEPDDVAGWKRRRQHAKTDRLDARHLRELLETGKLPEGWIPPGHVLEIRAKVRPYKDLLEERSRWQQRVHATLYLGAPAQTGLLEFDPRPSRPVGGAQPGDSGSAADDRQLDHELIAMRAELVGLGRRQPGCRELPHEYGIGALTAVVIWSELGDALRYCAGRCMWQSLRCPSVLARHAYYEQVARRVGKQRAALSVAGMLARRCRHRLRARGVAALAPVE
jgi:hypothetical protein